MAFWANDPGTLPRVLEPDERPRGDLNVYLDWSPGEDADWDGPQAKAPKARALFLGQLPDDQPDDPRADDPADSEQFEPDAELTEPVEIPTNESEQSWAPVIDEPIGDATAAVPPVATAAVPRIGGREARRAARNQRARLRRARIGVVVGVITALVGGAAVYVGTRPNGGDQRARRPTSTSLERKSSPTTATTVAAPETAPATELAPSDPGPGSAVPASNPGAPRGTSPSQTGATGAGGGPAAASQPAPGSTGAPPSGGAPPSAPPRSPTCQLLPVVCR